MGLGHLRVSETRIREPALEGATVDFEFFRRGIEETARSAKRTADLRRPLFRVKHAQCAKL